MSYNESPQDDFARAFDGAFAQLRARLERVCAGRGDWPHRLAVAIHISLGFAATDPAAAQLLTNEALARGAEGIARYELLIAYLRESLAPGRQERPEGELLPEIIERAMASGVVMLVAQRVDQGKGRELPAIVGEAIQFVLTPYLGIEEARLIGAEHAA